MIITTGDGVDEVFVKLDVGNPPHGHVYGHFMGE